MSEPAVGTVMPWHRAILDRLKWKLIRFRRRWLPYLVWWGQEIDVCVTLSQDKLPHMEFSPDDGPSKVSPLFSGTFAEIERTFNEMGITFDKGIGFEGRDWEWDWSLEGPIHIKFRGRARKPWLRRERPKPTLVYEKKPGVA